MASSILQIEQEKRLLHERKEKALEEYLVQERKLEELQRNIDEMQRIIITKNSEISQKNNEIEVKNSIVQSIETSIVSLRQEKDAVLRLYDAKIEEKQQTISGLQREFDSLSKDVARTQNSLDISRQELGEVNENIKNKGDELFYLIKSVDEEKKTVQSLIIEQEMYRNSIEHEKQTMNTKSKELQAKEEELYTLRSDLNVIKDRFARFAQENNLNFTI